MSYSEDSVCYSYVWLMTRLQFSSTSLVYLLWTEFVSRWGCRIYFLLFFFFFCLAHTQVARFVFHIITWH